MAISVAKVTGADSVWGNKRVKVRDITFSGNYATGGEALVASDVDLRVIEQVIPQGVASAADLATSNSVHYDHANNKLVFYESGASGTAQAEKTNGEAYPTGSILRATFIGY